MGVTTTPKRCCSAAGAAPGHSPFRDHQTSVSAPGHLLVEGKRHTLDTPETCAPCDSGWPDLDSQTTHCYDLQAVLLVLSCKLYLLLLCHIKKNSTCVGVLDVSLNSVHSMGILNAQ